jgi:nicotinamidase-related amidase
MTTALLLIDIQNDYFPHGAMPLANSEAASQRASELIATCRKRELPIIHIQHISTRPNATFFLPGTSGIDFHRSVTPQPHDTVIIKHFPNSFRETSLLPHLRQNSITRLIIAGMMTHMCVDTTVRAAADLGFSCMLAHDACATRELVFDGNAVPAAQVQTAYLAALNGLFATVQSVDAICATL